MTEEKLPPGPNHRGRPRVTAPSETDDTYEAVQKYGMGAFSLTELDRKVMAIHLKFPSAGSRSIALALGESKENIERILKKPAFQEAYRDYILSTSDVMIKAAREAAQKLRRLINSSNEAIALGACRVALAPYINQTKIKVEVDKPQVFKTTIEADGTLVQSVIEAQLQNLEDRLNADDKDPLEGND